MGVASTDPVTGKPTFNDTSTTQADLQKAVDFADPSTKASVATASALPTLSFPGQQVWVIDERRFYVSDGTTFRAITYPSAKTRIVPGTASGSLTAGSTINLFANQTIPTSPFGPGVKYTIKVKAYAASAPSSGALVVSVLIDGAHAQSAWIGTASSAVGTTDITAMTQADHPITNPDTTHTVTVQIGAGGAGLSIRANGSGLADISGAVIELVREDTF